jgi:hypothetical protein
MRRRLAASENRTEDLWRLDSPQGAEELIGATRAARSPDPEDAARKADYANPGQFKLNLILESIGGVLAEDPEFPNEVEKLIEAASDETFEKGRAIILSVKSLWQILLALTKGNNIGAAEAFDVAFEQREFACFLLVLGIFLSEKGPQIMEKLFKMT